jgi:hypothetical protein
LQQTPLLPQSIEEENDENIDPVNNFDPEDSEDDFRETDSTAGDKKLNAIIASDKMEMPCFRCVTKNSCSIPNCEYSHDRDIIAAARDKQMADLTEAKRQMQAGHQATFKVFDKQGAKVKQPQQSFLAMMSSPGTDDSRSSTPVSIEPEVFIRPNMCYDNHIYIASSR